MKYPHERHGLAGQSSNHSKPVVMADFFEFVKANSQPNCCQAGSYSAQYFLPKFTRVDPPKPNEKSYELKARSSVIAEFNRAQEESGRGTCGKTTVREWLKQHRPKHALHPSTTDYFDTCKISKEKLSRNQAVQKRLRQSGSASVDELQHQQRESEREREQYESVHKAHSEHAENSRDFCRQMTKKCSEDWFG